ncbi:MAG: UDP-glucose 4-epimerase GalE [Terriglobia bacterium]
MKKVLVTGGAGYIGSHVVKALLEAGDEVVTFDNLSEGHREAVVGGDLVQGDLSDGHLLHALFSKFEFDAVMHFAAHCYVGESVEDPEKYYNNNVCNLLNLLEVARKHKVNRIIFSSTAAVYGDPVKVPIEESHPLQPINPYGFTKLVVENILRDYSRAYGLASVSLRYFNAAGADPSGRLGESHDPEPHLIPRVLAVASGRLSELEVFGTDYPTEDGTCVRDYIHVNDLALAHLAALKHLRRGGENLIVNLGNSRGDSVKEIIQAAEQVTQQKIRVIHSPRRAGDPPVLVCNNSRAKERLHWVPKISTLDEIIGTAWRWEQNRRY